MRIITTQKYIKATPRKLRLLAKEIVKITPAEAVETLPYVRKRAAEPMLKSIKTALANAKVRGADLNGIKFSEIQIQEGPKLKRGQAVSKGRWHPVVKRMSHIKIVLETNGTKN